MPRKNIANIVDVQSVARGYTTTAMNVLAGVARSPKSPPAARVAAAVALLDRGWGKPDQAHVGADGGDIKVTIRQIIENVGETRQTQPAPELITQLPGDQDDDEPTVN